MECDYTHLNHNSLVSQKQKKSGYERHNYKGGLLYLSHSSRLGFLNVKAVAQQV
jgi:hypothetical protein